MRIRELIERGGDDLYEFKSTLKSVKKDIETLCELTDEMEEKYGERGGMRGGMRGSYSSRDDWDEMEERGSRRRYR